MATLKSAAMLLLMGGLHTFLFAAPLTVLLIFFLARVPEKHRRMRLGRMWFLAVPLVHMVWIYFAVTRVSQSFQQTFAARGRSGQGDCGYKLGLAMVVAFWVMSAAPMLVFLSGSEQVDVAIVGSGALLFAFFGAYVVRMTSAAKAMI